MLIVFCNTIEERLYRRNLREGLDLLGVMARVCTNGSFGTTSHTIFITISRVGARITAVFSSLYYISW